MSDSDSDSGKDFSSNPYSESETSNAKTTPSQRADHRSMTEEAKRRVDRATSSHPQFSGSRCLIENTMDASAVDYAHCLPRATKGNVLDSLEFAWHMDRFTLNIDTRYNIIRLSATFHRLYDSNMWLLLPEARIIDKFHRAKNFPNVNDNIYQYTFIAHPDLVYKAIYRQNSFPITKPPTPPSPANFAHHLHPYHTFPIIFSHVHPCFIICNSGAKLLDDLLGWQEQYPERKDDLTRVQAIWVSWTKPVPRNSDFMQKKYYNDSWDIDDNSSQKTTPRRILPDRTARKRPAEQGSPTPQTSKKKKEGGGAADCAWFDDETLHEFDRQTLSSTDGIDQNNYLVLKWLKGVLDIGEGDGGDFDSTLEVGMASDNIDLRHL